MDVTVLGATGFTGGLTAQHVGSHLPPDAVWAIAGRSRRKLESVAQAIVDGGGVSPQIRVVDVADAESMSSLARSTRVLISALGPYGKWGEPAVKACAENGTDYVDLSAEMEFIDSVWLRYDAAARHSGARLVHACGFDSVPFDLGVLHAVNHLPDDVPINVKSYIHLNATISGGTFHSAVRGFARARHAHKVGLQRAAAEAVPTDRTFEITGRIGRADGLPGWGLPLPTVDPQVVVRSARANTVYGPDFTYSHNARFQRLWKLLGTVVFLGVMNVASRIPPTRALILKFRDQGSGPDEEERARSWFHVDVVARGGGKTVRTRVSGGDPGYTEASKMLAESALCLAFDDLPAVDGQTTTATAMGDALINRLKAVGIGFEVTAT